MTSFYYHFTICDTASVVMTSKPQLISPCTRVFRMNVYICVYKSVCIYNCGDSEFEKYFMWMSTKRSSQWQAINTASIDGVHLVISIFHIIFSYSQKQIIFYFDVHIKPMVHNWMSIEYSILSCLLCEFPLRNRLKPISTNFNFSWNKSVT